MSTVEDRVRDALQADAQSVRPEAVPALRLPDRPAAAPRQSRRPIRAPGRPRSRPARWLVPLSAAAAVALFAAGASVLSSGGGHRPEPTRSRPAPIVLPAGVPRYFIRDTGVLQVYSAATGQLVGTVQAPHAAFTAVAGTADPHVFLAVAAPFDGSCSEGLYRFRLNAQGHPGPLTSLHITVPGTLLDDQPLAATPDGRTVAYSSFTCGNGPDRVGVISVATGRSKVWARPHGRLGPVGVALSADGRRLSFSYGRPRYGAEDAGGFAVLNTSRPGGSLMRYSHKVPGSPLQWALLAGDGTTMYGCSTGLADPAAMAYYRISVRTGHRRVIAHWSGLPDPNCKATLDPAGRYALIADPAAVPNGGEQAVLAILNLKSGAITRIPAPAAMAEANLTW